jgi:hypothetical protein
MVGISRKVSSSAEASPEEIDVTVKVLQYRTGSKK